MRLSPISSSPTKDQQSTVTIRMTTKNPASSGDDSSSPRRNRIDLLQPDFTPHAPVQRLGQDLLHGPSLSDHIVIILGVGPGLGLSIATAFAERGYTTALLSRTKSRLDGWASTLHETALAFRTAHHLPTHTEAKDGKPLSAAFACDALDSTSITTAVKQVCEFWPAKKIGTACFNASVRKRGPFLQQRLEQVHQGVQASILAGFVFAQSVIAEMQKHAQGGNLIVTGATSSTRGREGFAGFAASSKYSSLHLHACWAVLRLPLGVISTAMLTVSFCPMRCPLVLENPQSLAYVLCVRYVRAPILPSSPLLADRI